MNQLNEKQRKAIKSYAEGNTLLDSGIAAGYAPSCAAQTVSRLLTGKKSKDYLAELNSKADVSMVMSFSQRKTWLSDIMRDTEAPLSERVRCCDILNRCEGRYIQKVEQTIDAPQGGIMLIPVIGDGSLDDWQAVALPQQERSKFETLQSAGIECEVIEVESPY